MRLTLRTLLAYLDDLLKPVDAKALGRRLSESPAASSMAKRIREVLRRRRIGAPGLDDEPDPNTVAEYLDNTLADELVEDHERACLGSDEVLAETAACHQILSLVMGKPIAVSDSMKAKAYELEVGPEPATNGELVPPPRPGQPEPASPSLPNAADVLSQSSGSGIAQSLQEAKSVGKAVGKQPSTDPLPSYLADERSSAWQRWVGGTLLAIAAVAAFAFLYQGDSSYERTRGDVIVALDDTPVQTPESVGTDNAAVEKPASDDVASKTPAAAASKTTEPTTATPKASEPVTPPAVAILDEDSAGTATPMKADDGEPEPSESDPATGLAKADDAKPPMVGALPSEKPKATDSTADTAMKPAASTADTTTPEPPKPEPTVEPAPTLPAFQWQQSGDGLALHVDEVVGGWSTLIPRALVFGGERLVVPEPFECAVRVDEGPILTRLLSNTDLKIRRASTIARGGLDVAGGRLVTTRLVSDDAAADPIPFTFAAHGNKITLALGPGAEVAFDVQSEPAAKIDGPVPMTRSAVITVIQGPVYDVAADGTPVGFSLPEPANAGEADLSAVSTETAAPDSNADTDAATAPVPTAVPVAAGPRVITLAASPSVAPFEATPAWAIEGEVSSLTRRYATMFRKLLPDQRPLKPELLAILQEPTYRMSELAATSLTLLEEISSLVMALDSVHEETRIQAIHGIRQWWANDPSRVDELQTLLSTAYRPEVVETLVELLRGYSIDDGRRPSVSNSLVGHLEDADVAVREAALFQLKQLTDKTFDYHPSASLQSRGVAVRRWRDYVAREGALLTPVIEDEDEPLE